MGQWVQDWECQTAPIGWDQCPLLAQSGHKACQLGPSATPYAGLRAQEEFDQRITNADCCGITGSHKLRGKWHNIRMELGGRRPLFR